MKISTSINIFVQSLSSHWPERLASVALGLSVVGCGMLDKNKDGDSKSSNYPLMIVMPSGSYTALALLGEEAVITEYIEEPGNDVLVAQVPFNVPVTFEGTVPVVEVPEADPESVYTMQIGGTDDSAAALVSAPGEVPAIPEGSTSVQVLAEENPVVVTAFRDNPEIGSLEVIRGLVGSMESSSYNKDEMKGYLSAAAKEIRNMTKEQRKELAKELRGAAADFVASLKDPATSDNVFEKRKLGEAAIVAAFVLKNPALATSDAGKLLQGKPSEVTAVASKLPAAAAGPAKAEELTRKILAVLVPAGTQPDAAKMNEIRGALDYIKAVIVTANASGASTLEAVLLALKNAMESTTVPPTASSIKAAVVTAVTAAGAAISQTALAANLERIEKQSKGTPPQRPANGSGSSGGSGPAGGPGNGR